MHKLPVKLEISLKEEKHKQLIWHALWVVAIDELFVVTEAFKAFGKHGYVSFCVSIHLLPGIKQFHWCSDSKEPVPYFTLLKWQIKEEIKEKWRKQNLQSQDCLSIMNCVSKELTI